MAEGGRKSKKEARYVDVSQRKDERCGNCSMFRPPSICTYVQGKIARAGWCKFWDKK